MLTSLIFFAIILINAESSSPLSKKIITQTKMLEQGGAINEKIRQSQTGQRNKRTDDSSSKISGYSPVNARSHLWHALEGLDRYPNYLNRWNDDRDLDALEHSLEQSLIKVRQQRGIKTARRQKISEVLNNVTMPDILRQPASWETLLANRIDPALRQAISGSRQFKRKQSMPSIHEVLSGEVGFHLDDYMLEQLMEEEVFDIYSFPVFKKDFCKEIRTFVDKVSVVLAENGVVFMPTDLDLIGLGWISDFLLHIIIRPISRHLFKGTELKGGDLDWRQGYVAKYRAQQDTEAKHKNRLVVHTDDSEVTLNIGLGADFEGGLLQFWGLRGQKTELLGTYSPIPGRAILHVGRHFHQVTRVTKGERYALIVWARSWADVRSKICPCCWLNRRQDNNCICGLKWN